VKIINETTVLAELCLHIGKDKGITCKNLAVAIRGGGASLADHRRIRHVIEALRLEGQHICAHPSEGYFIASDEKELDETCNFLANRAMKSLAQVSRMKRIALPDIHGQMRLKV